MTWPRPLIWLFFWVPETATDQRLSGCTAEKLFPWTFWSKLRSMQPAGMLMPSSTWLQ